MWGVLYEKNLLDIFTAYELPTDKYHCLNFLDTVARALQYFLADSTS